MSFIIKNLTAIVGIDPESGDEGVWGFEGADGGWIPMIMADEDRFRSVLPIAISIAKEHNRKFRVLRFSTREDITESIEELK